VARLSAYRDRDEGVGRRSSGVEYMPLLDMSDCRFFCGGLKERRIESMIREALFGREDIDDS